MSYWLPIPFILNLIQFVTLTPNNDPNDPNWPNVRSCTVKDGNLQLIVEMSDILLCYVLPCLIVVILNVLIFSKVISAEKNFALCAVPNQPYSSLSTNSISSQQTKLASPSNTVTTATSNTALGKRAKRTALTSSNGTITMNNGNSRVNTNSSSSGSTRILLVLPIVYIMLNTPFYLIRLADTIALNMFNSTEFSIQGGLNNKHIRWLNNGAHYLYYGNFACDVVVYAFSSSTFRRSVCKVWCNLLCPKWTSLTERYESNGGRSCGNSNRFSTNKSVSKPSYAVRLLDKYTPTEFTSITTGPPPTTTIINKNGVKKCSF